VNNWIEADFIFFGYGKLTENIINSLINHGQRVICVSNSQKIISPKSKVKCFLREEIIHKKVKANNAIFAWSNTSPFGDNMLMNWIKTDSLLLNRSLLLSSSSVYKESHDILSEDQINLEPNFMGNEKYNLESNLVELFKSKEIQHSNLRISNVYGSGLSYGFIASLLSSIKNESPAKLFKQKDIVRDYLSIKDLTFAIENLVKLNNTEVNVNVSTGIGITIHEILEIFGDYGHNFESRIEIDVPTELKKNVVLDCSLLKSKITWNPTPVKIGIRNLLDDLKLNI
jgi:nucleoside-diphosphate-sugar epimerase